MMRIQRFEDIIAWQKAQDLGVLVYKLFDESKDRSFRSQICRASVSISNNIAEGFNRGTTKEFIRFLSIARASCDEVKSMSYLAERLSFIDSRMKSDLIQGCEEVSKLIYGLIKSIEEKNKPRWSNWVRNANDYYSALQNFNSQLPFFLKWISNIVITAYNMDHMNQPMALFDKN